jgi:leucyl aminopeptidase (aminopeptidase T)
MMERLPELHAALARILRACRAAKGEKVVAYLDTGREHGLEDAFQSAVQTLGAEPLVLRALGRAPLIEPPTPAVEAMAQADFVLDLASESWLYTPATSRILKAGARMLQILMPTANILKKEPTEEIVAKAQAAERLFASATEVRIASRLGTDFRASYEGRAPAAQDGVVQAPGEWDSLGTAFANVCPLEDTGNGTLVFNGPFYLAGGTPFIAREPVEVAVRDGRIEAVRGGDEARRFRAWLDGYDDPGMRVVAHIGFGFDPRAGPPPRPVDERDWVSWEAMNGGVIVAFGANTIDVEFKPGQGSVGGTNVAKSHCDCEILEADFYIGSTQIIKEGAFVMKEFA